MSYGCVRFEVRGANRMRKLECGMGKSKEKLRDLGINELRNLRIQGFEIGMRNAENGVGIEGIRD